MKRPECQLLTVLLRLSCRSLTVWTAAETLLHRDFPLYFGNGFKEIVSPTSPDGEYCLVCGFRFLGTYDSLIEKNPVLWYNQELSSLCLLSALVAQALLMLPA